MTKPYQIYRLELDENGQEDNQDFSTMPDAEKAFLKATRRKSVFSASVYAYNAQAPFNCYGRIFHYEQD